MITNLLLKRLLLLWVFAFSITLWGQTDNLTCSTGTIVGTTMSFNTTNFTVVHSKGTDANFASYSPWRVYTGNNVTFTAGTNVKKITSIVINAETNAYATSAVGGTVVILDGIGTISKSALLKVATITVTGNDVKQIRVTPNAQSRWVSVIINYEPVSAGPVITATPGSLGGFNYIENSGPSSEKTFTLGGSNLTDHITVTAPAAFEVSKTTGTGFANEVNFTQTGGNVASTPVHVRLKSGLSIANYTGDLTLTSAGASNVMVSLSGVVTPPIAATSNNNSFGTVSLAGNVITATPLAGYTYASPAYTVIPNGSATVTQNGNEFTVTPNASTTVQINFAAKPNFTLSLRKDGSAYTNVNFPFTTYEGNTIVLPTLTDGCGNFTFVGWDTNSGTASAPTYAGGATYTTTASDVTLYAVYSQTAEGGTTTSTYGFEDADTGWTSTMTKSNLDKKTGTYSGLINKDGVSATFNSKVVSPLSLSFSLKKTSTNNNYEIYVQTSPDNSTWTTRETFLMSSFTNGSWVEKTADLSTYSDVYVRLDYYGTTAVRYLDDISLVYEGGLVTTYTTSPNCPITWNGTDWSNIVGPDAATPANIEGDYSGPAFIAKSLTVNIDATLTVNSSVTTGDVTNYGEIIVDNNANFIQTGNFVAENGSSFKVKRSSKEVKRLDYIAWSSPMKVSDQTLKSFSNGTVDTRFFTYNNGNYVKVATPAATKFTPGQGFQIRTPNDFTTTPQKFSGLFEGTEPNSGPVTYDASLIDGQYVFLGNPYPSALDMEAFNAANNQITGTFYIWNSASVMDVNNEYSGSNYNTYTQLGTVPAGLAAGYVPVGQGFFVDRGANVINDFIFTDAMRSADQTGAFSKSGTSDKFWLQMTAPSGAKPQMLIGFHPNATVGYDAGLDGKMFDSNADVIYSTVDNQSLIINAHGSFNSADVINVNAEFLTAGNYTISLAQKEGIFANEQPIYLKDNVTGAETELTSGDYTFAATAGLQASRFTVAFSKGVLANADLTKGQAKIYASQSVIYAIASSKIAAVEVYDMSGKLMQTVSGKQATALSFSVNHNGIVVVRMVLENGEITTNRLLLKK